MAIKLGELLVRANVLQEGQLRAALAEQKKWGGRLGEILVRMSMLTEELLVKALSKQLAIPIAALDGVQGIPPAVKNKVSAESCRQLAVVPLQLRDNGKTLVLAMAEPQDIDLIDKLRAQTKCRVIAQVAGRSQISRAIARFYEPREELSDAEGSFKVVDSQGRTVVRSRQDVEPSADGGLGTPAAVPSSGMFNAPFPSALAPTPPSTQAQAPSNLDQAVEILRNVEDIQRKEVAVLKAMVELMIERGIFTRDEYLAKVKR